MREGDVRGRYPDNYCQTLVFDQRRRGSAQRSMASDNCYRDRAVTNARQLADLLNGADAFVVRPDPFNESHHLFRR